MYCTYYLLFAGNFSYNLECIQTTKQHGVYSSDWIGSRERSRFSEKENDMKPQKKGRRQLFKDEQLFTSL